MSKNDPRALLDGWVMRPLEQEGFGGGDDPIHQQFEHDWWGDCLNTFGEEAKQITYAHRMGLVNEPYLGHWPRYDLAGKAILDIGGGPSSLLLKCFNRGAGSMVLDPLAIPEWVLARYVAADIHYRQGAAEDSPRTAWFDEVWLYNVLQHVRDPHDVLFTARQSAPLIRIFEWIDMPTSLGHPHTITAAMIRAALGDGGEIDDIHENGADGMALYGVFQP